MEKLTPIQVGHTPAGGRVEYYSGFVPREVLYAQLDLSNVRTVYGIEGYTGQETVVEYCYAALPLVTMQVLAEGELEPATSSERIAAD